MTRSVVIAFSLMVLIAVPSAYGAGYYVGGSLGASFAKWDPDDIGEEDFKLDGADFAYKIFGGYKLIPLVSIEGGYRDLGKITDGVGEVVYGAETSGWDVEAMGILPLGMAHAWVKVGYIFWSSDSEFGSQTESDSGSDFMWGIGGDMSILTIAVRVEWEKFEIEDADHISMFSGGVTFGF